MPLYTVFALSDFSDSHVSAFTRLTVGPPAREMAQGRLEAIAREN